ncbi:MAG: right-handed parallel beta-helix repeat-containing protein, partial [Thermoplasmata archaeon]
MALALAATASFLVLAAGANAATFVVHNTTELEAAVTSANGNTEANTIELTAGTYLPTKTLIFTNTHGTQTVAGPVGKTGEATPGVTLSGNAVTEVAGVSEKELITVKTGVTATLKHVVVTGGGEGANAGIEDAGTLNVENATISGNIGTQIQVASGATANLTNSTLSDGHAFGLGNEGTASFVNVTVVHNASGGIGGNAGTLSLTNTIVALNGPTATPQCSGNTITNDHSLASDASCGGEAAFQNKTPLLQTSLLNDGGSTTLYSEKAGSPTIDAGDPAKCPATDQRGYPRPDVASTVCDIGADEYSPTPPTITVPAEIVTPTTGTGAVVTYSVEATDPDALVKELSCVPASGAT